MKNTTGKHLLAGPITVLDANSYAGDASIDNVPPGQERLISYGVDLQVIVDATKNTSDSAIQTGKIIKGVLYLTRKNLFTQEYVSENKGDHDKTLIIEHPTRGGLASGRHRQADRNHRTALPLQGQGCRGKGRETRGEGRDRPGRAVRDPAVGRRPDRFL